MTLPDRIEAAGPEDVRGTCHTCRWWTGKIVGHVKYDGQCRFNPPANGSPRWPITDAYEWCGRHATALRAGADHDR